MKTRFFITTVFALLTVGVAMAQDGISVNRQVNTIVVNTSGDIFIRQDVNNESTSLSSDCLMEDSILIINGHEDYALTVAELNHLIVNSRGDVITDGTLRGKDIGVIFNSSGDSRLDLDYDNVYAYMNGSGDLVLRGRCNKLYVENNGSGDINTKRLEVPDQNRSINVPRAVPSLAGLSELLAELGVNLERLADSVDWDSFLRDMESWGESMEEWGRHMEEWGDHMEDWGDHMEDWGEPGGNPRGHYPGQRPPRKHEHQTLLFDPHWCGIDAGLNLFLGNELVNASFNCLELRPMRSWVFNFNIADVGVAFNRSHTVGLYTGVGLGWNNYSFANPIRLFKGDDDLEYSLIDETVEGKMKKSKLGVLYVQAPLMLEVRPTRNFFIAAGVTGGLRVDTWTKVKFMDRYKEKTHSDYYVNLLKLDATLRAGSNDMGFFASYNLVPLFVEGKGPDTHTFNVGFSLLF